MSARVIIGLANAGTILHDGELPIWVRSCFVGAMNILSCDGLLLGIPRASRRMVVLKYEVEGDLLHSPTDLLARRASLPAAVATASDTSSPD